MTEVLDRDVDHETTGPGPATGAVDLRAIGVRAALGGAAVMVLGVVAGEDAGRPLLLAGAGLVIAGLALAAVGPALYGPSARSGWPWRVARIGAPIAVLALLGGLAAWTSRAADDTPPAGTTVAGMDHSHETAPAADHAVTDHPVTGTGGHVHDDGPPVPLDPATQKALSAQLALTRAATMRYPTVADAQAGGLRRIGNYSAGSGAHYMLDPNHPFDPANPNMWLFAGNEPTSPVVGVMFYNMALAAPPEGFAGPNDHWHMHTGLCINNVPEGIGLPLPIDKDATKAQCDEVHGNFMNVTGWMIHVWSAPGWESPQGVFSHDNPQLVCSDGRTSADTDLHIGCQGMA